MKRILILALLALAAGCTSTTFTDGKGRTFTRKSLGTNAQFKELTVKEDGTLTLKGYTNDQAEVAAAVVAAAVNAANPVK